MGSNSYTNSITKALTKRLTPLSLLERAKGIEPSASAWEAGVLPLYDARILELTVR